MTAPHLDPTIHAPNRLQICALLAEVDTAEFRVLREALEVSDSVVSKHLKVLEEAGYLASKKGKADGKRQTRLSLTKEGRAAFAGHVAELQRLAGLAVPSQPPSSSGRSSESIAV